MKIEIRKEIREYILEDVNMTLRRLGISEQVKETKEWTDRHDTRIKYNFESPAINQMPVMFKKLIVVGDIEAYEPKVKEGEEPKSYYEVVVRLEYSYNHFGGGSNGCSIGYVYYNINKDVPEDLTDTGFGNPYQYYVRKVKGLDI